MPLGDVLAKFPQVKPEELEVTTHGRGDGVFLKVVHLPSGTTREVTGLTPDSFDPTLRKLVEEVLAQATAPKR